MIRDRLARQSIEGAGTFQLGSNQLTVGSNNLSTTVSGVIAGAGGGSLVKTGTGILVLSGTNTYTGTTTVNSGALVVNGSIASSSLTTVNSGAALIGSGTVGSTVVNSGGFLVPGPVGTPGAMTVAGNLALQSGAFYIVQVNPGAAATTNVSGTAALAGTVGAIFLPGSYMTHSYTILSAAGGLTGTFDVLRTAGLPAGLAASLSFTGNTAVLNLTAQLVPGPTPPPGGLVPSVPGAVGAGDPGNACTVGTRTAAAARSDDGANDGAVCAAATVHRQSAQRRPCDRQFLQQRRHAAASIRVALWVVGRQSHHRPGPAFRIYH